MPRFSLIVLLIQFLFAQATWAASGKYSLGFGYLQFSESISISEGSDQSKGVASYAGPALVADYATLKKQLMFGTTFYLAAGRASAGQFDGVVSFDDAIKRGWWVAAVNPYLHYRLTRDFMLGGGIFARVRTADWRPASQVLTVQTSPAYSFGPQLDFRILLNRHLILNQSIAFLDLRTHTQWLFSAYYVF